MGGPVPAQPFKIAKVGVSLEGCPGAGLFPPALVRTNSAVAAHREDRLARLAGPLRIPETHRLDDYSLEFLQNTSATGAGQERRVIGAEDWERDPDDPQLARFALDEMVPGTYDLYVEPVAHRLLVELPIGGRSDLDIELPPAASGQVRVVDETTGQLLRPIEIYWMDGEVDGMMGNQLANLPWSPERECFSFDTVAGEVQIQVAQEGYFPQTRTHEMHPGENEIRIPMPRAHGMRVTLYDGDAQYSSDPSQSFWWQIEFDYDGPRQRAAGSSTLSERTMVFERPGEYRVRFPKIDGFEAIEAMTIDVPYGEMVEVRVPLRRE